MGEVFPDPDLPLGKRLDRRTVFGLEREQVFAKPNTKFFRNCQNGIPKRGNAKDTKAILQMIKLRDNSQSEFKYPDKLIGKLLHHQADTLLLYDHAGQTLNHMPFLGGGSSSLCGALFGLPFLHNFLYKEKWRREKKAPAESQSFFPYIFCGVL